MTGPSSEAFPVLAATLRSLLPVAERLGLVKPGAIEIETLADRLREESIALGTVITTPMCVGVWGRRTSADCKPDGVG